MSGVKREGANRHKNQRKPCAKSDQQNQTEPWTAKSDRTQHEDQRRRAGNEAAAYSQRNETTRRYFTLDGVAVRPASVTVNRAVVVVVVVAVVVVAVVVYMFRVRMHMVMVVGMLVVMRMGVRVGVVVIMGVPVIVRGATMTAPSRERQSECRRRNFDRMVMGLAAFHECFRPLI